MNFKKGPVDLFLFVLVRLCEERSDAAIQAAFDLDCKGRPWVKIRYSDMTKVETISALLKPEVEALGYELWGVVYLPQGKHALLRVYIENEKGVSVDDCEKVSRQISAVLDVENVIASQYSLEVSSPGLDRTLFSVSQYARVIGKILAVRLHVPINNRRKFQGELRAVEGETICLNVEGVEMKLPFQHIEHAHVII